jgi:hypothetical protein
MTNCVCQRTVWDSPSGIAANSSAIRELKFGIQLNTRLSQDVCGTEESAGLVHRLSRGRGRPRGPHLDLTAFLTWLRPLTEKRLKLFQNSLVLRNESSSRIPVRQKGLT